MKSIKWLSLLLVLFLWGCNSKLTLDNYNKISMGMSYDCNPPQISAIHY